MKRLYSNATSYSKTKNVISQSRTNSEQQSFIVKNYLGNIFLESFFNLNSCLFNLSQKTYLKKEMPCKLTFKCDVAPERRHKSDRLELRYRAKYQTGVFFSGLVFIRLIKG